MATGDVLIFDEAMAFMLDGGWESADDIKIGVIDAVITPLVGDTTPSWDDYVANEVAIVAGGYTPTGGTSLGTWGTVIDQTSGVTKFDSATNPNWPQQVGGDTTATWAIIYNDSQTTPIANAAIAFVELGGPVDMSAGDLTITWAAGGIFTITSA